MGERLIGTTSNTSASPFQSIGFDAHCRFTYFKKSNADIETQNPFFKYV